MTDETLVESLEIRERIRKYNVDYILMSNLSGDSILTNDLHEPKEIWTGIQDEQTLDRYYALRQEYKIKPFLIMNSHNVEFIKSTVKFAETNVLGLRNKYKIIKSNNIINSNYWGTYTCFRMDDIHIPFQKLLISWMLSNFTMTTSKSFLQEISTGQE